MHKDSWYGNCSCQSWLEKYRMSLNMVWIDCHNIRPSTFMCSFLWEQNVGQPLVRRKCNTGRKESRYLYHKIIDVYMLSVVGQNGHFIAPCKGATLRSWVTLLTANSSGFICLFPRSPHGYMLSTMHYSTRTFLFHQIWKLSILCHIGNGPICGLALLYVYQNFDLAVKETIGCFCSGWNKGKDNH